MPACHSFASMNIVHLKIIIQYSAPICILNTSKWKQSEPVCIPLSSCLMDSSSVGGRSDGPGERGFSSCGWMLSVRVGSECSRGVPRPGPVLEGQFKAVINIHWNMTDRVHTWITCCLSTFVWQRHTHTQTHTNLYVWWARSAAWCATLCWLVWTWQPGHVCVQKCLDHWLAPPGLLPWVWGRFDLPTNNRESCKQTLTYEVI